MNIRKFFSIFGRSKETPVVKSKRRKPREAKEKVTPRTYRNMFGKPIRRTYRSPLPMQGQWKYIGPDHQVFLVDPNSPLSAGQRILISSAPYIEEPERKDPKNWEWVEPEEGK